MVNEELFGKIVERHDEDKGYGGPSESVVMEIHQDRSSLIQMVRELTQTIDKWESFSGHDTDWLNKQIRIKDLRIELDELEGRRIPRFPAGGLIAVEPTLCGRCGNAHVCRPFLQAR